jgi:hypothetical protein
MPLRTSPVTVSAALALLVGGAAPRSRAGPGDGVTQLDLQLILCSLLTRRKGGHVLPANDPTKYDSAAAQQAEEQNGTHPAARATPDWSPCCARPRGVDTENPSAVQYGRRESDQQTNRSNRNEKTRT